MEHEPRPSIEFEEQAPIANLYEALQMLARAHGEGEDRNINANVTDGRHGLYISMAMISGWPEKVEWAKNYLLERVTFDELRDRGYVEQESPQTWRINQKGRELVGDSDKGI